MAKDKKENTNPNYIPDVPVDEQVEFSDELADAEDREAMARAKAASQRVNTDNI
ncbi:YfhD family protein [Evansella sp. LMS18]|uniref:YfhD family protein n=1 Tax=Evansella sp. LMS18 TaxID=2924033 RepID=UPI0020D071BF|nr:YfhD family protein [Evansella sp. LMS18]UTR09033.1 YfhD family protein [Evansella sp. LMS18]